METKLTAASLILVAALAACATPNKEDMKLSSDVQRSLDADPALQADLLHVQAADHVIYLSGKTDSWLEYYNAEKVALAVPGVTRVVNKLDINNRY